VGVRFNATGSHFDVVEHHGGTPSDRYPVQLPLLGDFNVTNALGAFTALRALALPLEQITGAAALIPQVPGRLERLGAHPTVLRDYAHTPDAMERALAAVRPFAHAPDGTPSRVYVVFGCGGDRDRGKRPVMGGIAQRMADVVILTSDNPRTEDPERILDDIAAGCSNTSSVPVHRVEDRRAAIAVAMRTAAAHDVVLLAGKGHETYQIRGTQIRAFDEAEIVAAQRVVSHHEPYWTLQRVRRALQDVAVSAPAPENVDEQSLTAVVTDTRSMVPGALFVALRGARHDAHDLLAAAQAAGAAAVVVDRPECAAGLSIPVVVVHDTTQALGLLGRAWRRAWGGTVIAVGGSNGKTSTKELLRAALTARWRVHATAANENNQVGVPLTLLSIPADAEVAVVEIGTNTPGEVALLRGMVEANIAVVTSLGEEHLEGLGDLEGVLREEAALFEGVPVAVVPHAEPLLVAAARDAGCTVVTAGLDEGEVRPEQWALADDGRVRLRMDGEEATLPVRGAHQARNAMLALAVAQRLQVAATLALGGLTAMALPPMRGGWEQYGPCTVINDAYNANPPSMKAALLLLDSVAHHRQRVAVLGTMRELGAHSDRLHDEVARCAVQGKADIIVGIGDFMPAFERIALHNPRILTAPDVPSAWERLRPLLAADALLLLKGSRGARLETLLPLLTSWAGA
jgi:UDP-N-acetylmuramoyl-tripeptide--D-alanyl-D-alanine ligase